MPSMSYLVLGLGASYYLFDGFNVGLFYESWTGSDPKMTKITPSVQYVFYQVEQVKPYVGAFYRRSSIDGLKDLDSVGGRAGAYLQVGRNAYLGLGAVYESYIDCKTGPIGSATAPTARRVSPSRSSEGISCPIGDYRAFPPPAPHDRRPAGGARRRGFTRNPFSSAAAEGPGVGRLRRCGILCAGRRRADRRRV